MHGLDKNKRGDMTNWHRERPDKTPKQETRVTKHNVEVNKR